ncbi:abortive infection protein [Acrocarpospora pleiomorpha]|uniref:Abortive infection protein n=1 Tax=Acrocarpospora pleiomorpha TaxID=90975 RepID=A0A5M3XVD9_9ACTN|nr:CPBP family intramembrane glutamic endopeptidase [Acrocarpospora pleiomorpha]GES23511.1 abortive infection protein [Acrocarpospora pleiomorpha]
MAGLKAVVVCCGVLAGANVMNNVVAKRWAPATSALATAVLLGVARREGLRGDELGFARWKQGVTIGGGLAAAVAATYAMGISLPRTRPLFRDERALALSRARLLEEALLQVPVGTVMLEEIAFRGVLPALLTRSVQPKTAAAISSALFGLWHILPALDMARANPSLSRLAAGELDTTSAPEPPHSDKSQLPAPVTGGTATNTGERVRLVAGTVVATSVAGAFFSALRRHGGLLAPALVHIATNSFGYVASRIARRIDAQSERQTSTETASSATTT